MAYVSIMALLFMVVNNHLKLIGTVKLYTKATKTNFTNQLRINVNTDGEIE